MPWEEALETDTKNNLDVQRDVLTYLLIVFTVLCKIEKVYFAPNKFCVLEWKRINIMKNV